jgi:hypothetical protein
VGWKASGAINHELAKFNLNAKTHAKMYRQGGSGSLPEITNLEDFARNFPTLINSSQGGAVTLELITKDYGGVLPFDLQADTQLFAQQQSIMQQLAQNRDQAMEMIRDIRYIQRNSNLFHISNANDLSRYEREFNTFINAQNRSAVNCIADVYQGCKLPDVAFPSVQMPTRQAYPQGTCQKSWEWDPQISKCCQSQLTRVCLLPHENGCTAWDTKEIRVCQ